MELKLINDMKSKIIEILKHTSLCIDQAQEIDDLIEDVVYFRNKFGYYPELIKKRPNLIYLAERRLASAA